MGATRGKPADFALDREIALGFGATPIMSLSRGSDESPVIDFGASLDELIRKIERGDL
jgi:hypothetical protein